MLLTSIATATPAALSEATSTVITDASEFAGMQAEWDALRDASASRSPFLAWEWLQSWWTHLRGSATLNLIAVRSGGRLIAVAPLCVRRRGLRLMPRLEFLGTGFAGSDYLDLIVRSGGEDEAIDALAREIAARQLPLHLDHLPPSALSAQLRQRLVTSGWTAMESTPDVCPVIDLRGHSWDTYLASLGSSHRANVRRRLRALAAGFEVGFALAESQDDRRTALEALFDFHHQRWAGRGGSTAFAGTRLRAFHQAAARRAHESGRLRLYVLTLNGEIAAVMYGFAADQRFYFYQHGFSGAYAKHGAGLVLMALTIRAAIESGAAEFDMLYGHEPYKYLWAKGERPLGRLQLFPPHIGGDLLRRQVQTRRALRAFAFQLGLKGSHDRA